MEFLADIRFRRIEGIARCEIPLSKNPEISCPAHNVPGTFSI